MKSWRRRRARWHAVRGYPVSRTSCTAAVLALALALSSSARADDPADEPLPEPEPCEGDDCPSPDADNGYQPPVTAGGNYTRATYPRREPERPLTMTRGILQLAAGAGADVSADKAFAGFGGLLEARYGYQDNVTFFASFVPSYNFHSLDARVGFEGALRFDLVDLKAGLRVSRAAFEDPADPKKYRHASTQLSLDLGFPLRYRARKELAVTLFESLIAIDFNRAARGTPPDKTLCAELDSDNCVDNGATPDLAPSLTLALAPLDQVSITVRARLVIADFDTEAGRRIPARVRAQVTPSRNLDVGLDFELRDVSDESRRFDERFVNLFVQGRFDAPAGPTRRRAP